MKRISIILIIFCFVGFAYGQNEKVLDLSKGGVGIEGIEVVKDESNDFIVLCNNNIKVIQIIVNAGIADTVYVNDYSKPDAPIFKESTTNKTNIKKTADKTIFIFESGHNYQISHNKKCTQ